jgi:hypothetical protein
MQAYKSCRMMRRGHLKINAICHTLTVTKSSVNADNTYIKLAFIQVYKVKQM